MTRLVLASASPARRLLLESAGLRPEVQVSGVDEGGVDGFEPAGAVTELARRKGRAVAASLAGTDGEAVLVLACDSMLEFRGELWGKAGSAEEVTRRWRAMRGGEGCLHTGHLVIDVGTGREEERHDSTVIRFGRPSDAEIDAYAGCEESRLVAGPFTLEGRSAPWVEAIDGNYGTVVGVSLPVLRELLARFGLAVTDLWHP